ncbi:MAG: hypothetical protein ACI4QS_01280 [Comamonas sp.]
MHFSPKLMAVVATAVMSCSAFALSNDEFKAEKDRIEAEYKAAKDQCKSMSGNAKDVCQEEAKGKEKVAKAELDFRKDGSESNRHKVAKAKADAAYDVAKEKCDDQSGNAKDVCEADAKAAHVKALEAAKVDRASEQAGSSRGSNVSEARKDAAENVREAEYKATMQRCDDLSGDAKDQCQNDAKRTHAQ